MKVLHHSTEHPIRRGLEKTLRHPMTYVGAFLVGGLSLYTHDYSWGFATPFLVPLFVQGFTRVMAECDHHAAHMRDIALAESHGESLPGLLSMDEVSDVLKNIQLPRTLIKITINQATEVVRLTEPDHLYAEARLIGILEDIVRKEFEDGQVYKLAYNAFMIVLDCECCVVSERLRDFISAHSPCKIKINDRTYYPRMHLGFSPMEDNLGESLSRVDFAADTASVSAERAISYVPKDDPDFIAYQEKRAGLRNLRRAIEHDELGLFAQPIVSLSDEGKPKKFEILLRHYQDGTTILPPMDILSFAEFNEATQDVDLYVFELVCRHFHRLFGINGENVETVTINIAGPSFIRPRFAETIIALADKYDVPADKLVLEVTEDVANSAKKQAIRTMETFRNAGFQLALDDIGTGSSNFRTLHEFPVNFFKIDRSYCEEIEINASVRTFVQLIIDIGKANNKQIIAEGIPDEKTRKALRSMGADYSQSFLTGRPEELVAAPKYAAEQ